ncbi:hypothetical protein D3C75_1042430 [compost metagenome]
MPVQGNLCFRSFEHTGEHLLLLIRRKYLIQQIAGIGVNHAEEQTFYGLLFMGKGQAGQIFQLLRG